MNTEWLTHFNSLARKGKDELFAGARCDLNDKKTVRHIVKNIADRLRLNSADTFLDLGCGTGILSADLSRKVNKYVGLDFGHDVLKRAKRNMRTEFVQGDITALPFADAIFDKVLCYSVVHYLQDDWEFGKALYEMVRVCKPGGIIMVGDIPERVKKEMWENKGRQEGESLSQYRLRQTTQSKYKISSNQFDRNRTKLNITSPQVAGVVFDTQSILQACHRIGVNGYVVAQPHPLPLSNTRVDLIIRRGKA